MPCPEQHNSEIRKKNMKIKKMLLAAALSTGLFATTSAHAAVDITTKEKK
jgi:hypothetical protein